MIYRKNKSKYVIDKYFNYIIDENFKFILFVYSRKYQERFNLFLFEYQYTYLIKRGINLFNYFNKDYSKINNRFKNDLNNSSIEPECISKFIRYFQDNSKYFENNNYNSKSICFFTFI